MNSLPSFFILSLISSAAFAFAASGSAGDKVSVELYYEALCPYCSNLIVNYLYKIFETDLISIADLKLIPYGNAHILPDGNIICQHGHDECVLNAVEACAIHAWPDVKDHFPFIYCVEDLIYHHNYSHWETCFEKLGLDASPVTDCYNSGLAKEILFQYAAVTGALEPPHTYVPWLVVDKQPLYDDYTNFASYICDAYKAYPKPNACSASSIGAIQKVKMDLLNYLHSDKASKSDLVLTEEAILSWVQGDKVTPAS